MSNDSQIPKEIDNFNWGAFILAPLWCLNYGWSIGWVLCIALPIVSWPYIGSRANKWLWKKGKVTGFILHKNHPWHSVEDFQRTQKRWMYFALAFWGILFLMVVSAFK